MKRAREFSMWMGKELAHQQSLQRELPRQIQYRVVDKVIGSYLGLLFLFSFYIWYQEGWVDALCCFGVVLLWWCIYATVCLQSGTGRDARTHYSNDSKSSGAHNYSLMSNS